MSELNYIDTLLSFLRWSIGLSIGCFIGLVMALIGSYKPSSFILKIINDFLRAIPIIGLVPVIQMNIGINEYGKIGLIAWAVIFPVWITVRNAIEKNLENSLLVLKAANISKYHLFKYFTFPKILGGFLRGIELAVGIAWLAVVAAEWVGTYTMGFWSGGLGYKMLIGYELNDWLTVHISLLLFGILGLITAYIWRLIMKLIFENDKSFNPVVKEITQA
jgi:sulfonate transport system permease protein